MTWHSLFGRRFGTLLSHAFFFLFIGAAAYAVSDNVDHVYRSYHDRYLDFVQEADRIQFLSVGNSHNMALDFDAIAADQRGFAYWYPGSDFREARYTVEQRRPHLSSLNILFLPVPLFVHDNATIGGSRASIRHRLYQTTGGWSYVDGDLENWLVSLLTPLARPDHWKGVVQQLISYQTTSRAGAPHRNALSSTSRLQELARKRGRRHRSLEEQTLSSNSRAC